MIRCVVFDFDGTLVDSNEIKARMFFEVVRPWDPEGVVVADVLKNHAGDRFSITREIAGRIFPGGLPTGGGVDDLAGDWVETYTQRCQAEIVLCEEIPGASDALSDLRERGVTLFVNSGTPTGPLSRAVEARSLSHYFTGVYGSPCDKLENLEIIRARAGVHTHEMLFVGDGPEDQEAAEKLPCHFVGVATDGAGHFARAADSPVRRIRRLAVLPALVTTL